MSAPTSPPTSERVAPAGPPPVSGRRGRRRSWLRQPTTIAAVVVLAASVTAGLVLGSGGGGSAAAATVGSTRITPAVVDREVAAIQSRPEYASALGQASTLALAAPVSPQAVAAVGGDPDDLRITLAPAGGAPTQRAYTVADLKASVLTRLLYVTVVRQLLAARHLSPTATEQAEGREQARYESGVDRDGHSLFDELPAWYQRELALRGADVETLERGLVGTGGITDAQVAAAYDTRRPTDFTTVCLRAAVIPSVSTPGPSGGAALVASQGRDDGCAPMGDWATEVQAAVRTAPAGQVAAPLQRGGKVALIEVTSRRVAPLSAVAGNVRAVLSSRYTDAVNTVVEDQLALSKVTVASQYGTYESDASVHGVVPPDALTSPPAGGGGGAGGSEGTPGTPGGTPARSGPQLPDPFE